MADGYHAWGDCASFNSLFQKAKRDTKPCQRGVGTLKEFWMFMGSLTLLFSACLITATTSIPVFNAITGLSIAPPEDVVEHHNNFQLWIGILIAIFSGIAQHVLYKKQSFKDEYARKLSITIGLHIIIASIITVSTMSMTGIQAWQYWFLAGTGYFAISSNLHY